MIGRKFNYNDVFFRDLTICLLDTMEGRMKWQNHFVSGVRDVKVPIYYSTTGDERFLLDSFSDDIVSNARKVELNTDIIPRGHITLKDFNIRSDEFRNPNIWLKSVSEDAIEVKRNLRKMRAIPITVNYDLSILLKTEIDVFKCTQTIMDSVWLYKFMFFEYNYMNIEAIVILPDSNAVEISREVNMTSDNTIKITLSLEVQTYYPSFSDEQVVSPGRTRWYNNLISLRTKNNTWSIINRRMPPFI